MKNKKLIILYIVLIILELIGFIYSYNEVNTNMFLYYTEDSNILLLIASILKIHYLLNSKKSKYINILNYTATLSTLITFLVVIFILGPNLNFNYKFLLLDGSMFFHHLVCPLYGLFLYLFIDKNKLNKKDIISSLSFTFIYAFIFIILNILKIVEGPYFFLMVYKQSIFMSIIWFIIIIGFSYILSCLIYLIKKKINN